MRFKRAILLVLRRNQKQGLPLAFPRFIYKIMNFIKEDTPLEQEKARTTSDPIKVSNFKSLARFLNNTLNIRADNTVVNGFFHIGIMPCKNNG